MPHRDDALREPRGEGEKPQPRLVALWREPQMAEQNGEHLALDAAKRGQAEAERLGRIKDDFLANLSHEIRTPVNAILGWSQLLKVGETSDEEMTEGLEVITRNARTQARLIDDMLDMSRIVSGKLRLDVERVSLPAIIE